MLVSRTFLAVRVLNYTIFNRVSSITMAEIDIEADHAVCFTNDLLFDKVKFDFLEKSSKPHHSLK